MSDPYAQQPQQPPYPQQPYGQPQYGQAAYPLPPAGYQPGWAGPQYAHWGLRLGARLLDGLLLIPGYIVGEIGLVFGSDSTTSALTQAVAIVLGIVGFLAAFAFSIWNSILRQGRTGSSLGKKWVGIAVISEERGTPIGGWPTFGRNLLHILDALPCYLGYLWPLWDAKKQTFADKIMKTIVVRRPQA